MQIIHHDARYLVADKPAGLLAVGPDSMHERLAAELGERLWVVHRLDRDTSGAIVFALDADAHKHLSSRFEEREVEKVYLAAVLGHLPSPSGTVELALREFGSGRMGVDARGKPSRTDYRVVERLTDADLLEVRPLTGRRHQIRVHLNAIGHPVLGDLRYGTSRPVGGVPRLMLHARSVAFSDADGRRITAESPVPPDFTAALPSA
jgi:RluA family pseudouridine synthase